MEAVPTTAEIMKTTILVLTLLCLSNRIVLATWSIVVIDEKTKEIGVAGASCTSDCSGIASIIPGNGAIVVQAMSNYNAHDMGRKAIAAGYPVENIMIGLREARFDPEHQQYALVTLGHPHPVTYTGAQTLPFNGALSTRGISVQGNVLSHPNELRRILDAAVRARASSRRIEDILMAALEAGSKAGGDRRCGKQKATSAFLEVAAPNDQPSHPFLHLVVTDQRDGKNAVEKLRSGLKRWNKEGGKARRNVDK